MGLIEIVVYHLGLRASIEKRLVFAIFGSWKFNAWKKSEINESHPKSVCQHYSGAPILHNQKNIHIHLESHTLKIPQDSSIDTRYRAPGPSDHPVCRGWCSGLNTPKGETRSRIQEGPTRVHKPPQRVLQSWLFPATGGVALQIFEKGTLKDSEMLQSLKQRFTCMILRREIVGCWVQR